MRSITVKAMLIVREGEKLLLSRGYDEAKKQSFLRPLGGHVEFGERGEDAIRREIQEELGCGVRGLKFLSTFENLFTYNGKEGHEIILMYKGRLDDESFYKKSSFTFLDGEQKIDAGWFSKKDAEGEDLFIYPPFSYFNQRW